jgi:hypothetical protein
MMANFETGESLVTRRALWPGVYGRQRKAILNQSGFMFFNGLFLTFFLVVGKQVERKTDLPPVRLILVGKGILSYPDTLSIIINSLEVKSGDTISADGHDWS